MQVDHDAIWKAKQAITSIREVDAVRRSFDERRVGHGWKLTHTPANYTYEAHFSEVAGRPDVIWIQTRAWSAEDEVSRLYTLPAARAFYRALVNAGYTAF
ncbi:hypothetical protein [Paraburkholderia sp. MM6662-R1]|uniref:hypothetical protein n=1 Tax=Paraburkholderia sp. MM6662-R1 TaxID=2991066 RepID=UPI003D241848